MLDRDITDEEINSAISGTRNGAAGGDLLAPEMLKELGPEARARVTDEIRRQWRENYETWDNPNGVQISLWKRSGNRMDKNKYRGIVLLALLTRLLARILASRLREWSEKFLRRWQFGFRPARSTDDMLYVIRRLHEESALLEKTEGFFRSTAFLIDLMKACPRTVREVLWAILESRGTDPSGQFIKTLRGMHDHTMYA